MTALRLHSLTATADRTVEAIFTGTGDAPRIVTFVVESASGIDVVVPPADFDRATMTQPELRQRVLACVMAFHRATLLQWP